MSDETIVIIKEFSKWYDKRLFHYFKKSILPKHKVIKKFYRTLFLLYGSLKFRSYKKARHALFVYSFVVGLFPIFVISMTIGYVLNVLSPLFKKEVDMNGRKEYERR